MNAFKAIQFSFPRTRSSNIPLDISTRRRWSSIGFSNSDGQGSGSSIPEGDKRKQELLAQIAMLQAQKVRLVDFLDDRSANLSQIVEDANSEFDAVGENALKELDDAGSRIMEKLDSLMQDFKESADINRLEIASNEKVLEELKEKIVRDRNDGLFLKNLLEETPQNKADSVEEVIQNLRQVGKDVASSKARRNIYIALMALIFLVLGIAFVPIPDVEWRKVGALSFILVFILAQFIYEQCMSSTLDETNKLGK